MKGGPNGSCERVAFCHLDLGVGGAERFIVDSALEVQSAGHSVHVYTSHYDPARCCSPFNADQVVCITI